MTKQECLDFLGITKWHNAGYTGKGISVVGGELTTDKFRSIHTDRLSEIIRPDGFGVGDNAQHGTDMFVHLLTVAPGITPISCAKSKSIEYVLENDIDIYVTALVSRQKLREEKEELIQKCIDKGCLFFISAGNYDEQGLAGESRSEKYWAIGGVELINEKWNKLNISSVGEELDFVCIAKWLGITGTSPMAYTVAGMCALVQQFFKERVGRKLNRSEMERFIKNNCKDVLKEGFDYESGYGLFILPNPEEIDVERYVRSYIDYGGFPEVNNMRICLDAGHGMTTPGKRSPDGSLLEYEFNRDVTLRLKKILEEHGVEVILTFYDDVDVPLESRAKFANVNNAGYFISIHANAYGDGWNDANGWEIYVVSKGGKAEKLAECIRKHSIELGLKDRGVKEGNFQVLRDTNMPAVLIEHGFYTNKEECEKLKSDKFRQKCAECDAKGILEFLGIAYNATTTDADMVLTIDKKEYLLDGVKKVSDVAPKIENGRTLVPIYLLRELGLKVEWNADRKEVSVWKSI